MRRVRRLPKSLSPAAVRLLRWLDTATDATPLGSELVYGAEEDERRRLAALGALARALAPGTSERWPEKLATWAATYPGAPDQLLVEETTQALKDESDDVLARVYEQVVAGRNRRRLGTFFTPPAIVEHMITCARTVLPAPDHVIDPGAGVGAFTLAVLRSWPSARVSAVDINAVTLGLLAARTTAVGPDGGGSSLLSLVPDDFLGWLRSGWPELAGPRLVLGNPPYTRHQLMSAKDKEAARTAAGQLITSGLAGLSTYFLAATINVLGPADALCLLLPASWCETRYGRELREWLWNAHDRRVELHQFPSRVAVFPGTQVMAMLLIVGPSGRGRRAMVVRDLDLEGHNGGRVVERGRVEITRSARCPPTFVGLTSSRPVIRHNTVPLVEHVQVRRGLVTGASRWFFLTDADRSHHQLPDTALRRAVVRPGHVTTELLTVKAHDSLLARGHPGWLLDLNDSILADDDGPVRSYVNVIQRHGAHLSVLACHRNPWYVVERVADPDLFLVPVSYGTYRVIQNAAPVIGSNNFFGLTVRPGAPWTSATLARWLRSAPGQEALRSVARHYQGGSLKIEPGPLRTLGVPERIARYEAENES